MQAERVVVRDTGVDCQPISEYNSNPIFYTHIYKVMFPDSTIQQYASYLIVDNIYGQLN